MNLKTFKLSIAIFLVLVGFFITIVKSLIFNEAKTKSSTYVYENGNSKVELKILNEHDYLVYDTPTQADFIFTNINPQTISIYGTGIKILNCENNSAQTEINVPNRSLKNDTLPITLNFEVNGSKTTTQFKIPIKSKD